MSKTTVLILQSPFPDKPIHHIKLVIYPLDTPSKHEINCCFTNFILGNLWFSSVFPIIFGSQEAFPSTFPAFSPSPPSLALPSPRQTSAAPGSCRWAWRRWPHAPRGSAPGALDLALGPRTSVQNIWGKYKYYNNRHFH